MSVNSIYKCSFCGVTEQQAKRIIAKGGRDEAAICNDCIVQCVTVLANLASISTLEERAMIETALIQGGEITKISL
ncbi:MULTISPECIES: ClpX C4-type zinc finger protein [Enterobacteriaceae]|uniref:ClpX C4-type zinc finger protein n=1 Tax=Enterobacteriaceae TaxID=543 RepID=UPI0008DD56BC|nr:MULTISPECIES: ClpX C4-type zinc finger protein [Enterobacteriaceae]QLW20927.1 hypothetical protein HV184_09130 [Enterobacter cloacae]MDL0016900.1 ClpX C4-type zinc finger protein [Enterobacter roggenkampii]MEA8736210.1 ClpX C4-type zinc finger protein [Klebsiella pneumoniae]MED5761329.1 ClpX C4-type zinc finger protein [Enterobacter roggenkampii]OHY45418.1 hypothetical protein BBX43_03565 [Enterobacter roggenkampii]